VRFDPEISEWGNLVTLISHRFFPKPDLRIIREVKKEDAIPGEVKHLSNRRKRKRIDSVSSGERKRKSPNRRLVSGVVGPQWIGEGTGKFRHRG
jgi:hypothetical protein